MSLESRRELLRAIAQLQRFGEGRFGTMADFKAMIWETRFVLTKVQGEMLCNAVERGTADKELLALLNTLNVAIHTCNEVDALSYEPTSNEKMLSSMLLAQVNFAAIEKLLVDKTSS